VDNPALDLDRNRRPACTVWKWAGERSLERMPITIPRNPAISGVLLLYRTASEGVNRKSYLLRRDGPESSRFAYQADAMQGD